MADCVVGPGGVPLRCNFNDLICPTGFKARYWRKGQFPELSNHHDSLASFFDKAWDLTSSGFRIAKQVEARSANPFALARSDSRSGCVENNAQFRIRVEPNALMRGEPASWER